MIKVLDNFLDDPWLMRARAIESEQWSNPNNTDYFTAMLDCKQIFEDSGIKERIEREVGRELVTHAAEFRLCSALNRTWVHTDHPAADISVIIYLNPNAPVDHGTTFVTHNEYGNMSGRVNIDLPRTIDAEYTASDMSQWKVVDQIGNVFNRCIIFDAKLWHKHSFPGFGNNKHTGRLTLGAFLLEKNKV